MDSVTFIIICVKALVVFGAIMLTVMVMTLAEAIFRLYADRLGPTGSA